MTKTAPPTAGGSYIRKPGGKLELQTSDEPAAPEASPKSKARTKPAAKPAKET